VIARNGVGYDSRRISQAATAKGIVVTNTPIAVRRPVAVATLTMIFALAGRLFKKHELVHTALERSGELHGPRSDRAHARLVGPAALARRF
jgi:phosphoglycerate dehydrogenase-like enzyme